MQQRLSGSVRIFYPKYNKEEIIQEIQKALGTLKENLPLRLVVLFGSYAKGNYTVASDIDLLVVYEGEERKDAYVLCKKTLAVPRLEPHVYSEKEYEESKKTIEKMIRNGIILFPSYLTPDCVKTFLKSD